MTNQLYLLGDVARMLDVQPHQIVYLFSSRKIPEVAMLGKRRVFGPPEVKTVAEALGVDWDTSKCDEVELNR